MPPFTRIRSIFKNTLNNGLSSLILAIVLIISQLPGLAAAQEIQNDGEQTKATKFVLPLVIRRPMVGPSAPGLTPIFEWTQDAHDGQRTGYTGEEPVLPWQLLWTWNGPDGQGGAGAHFYHAPREARTVTGGQWVFVPAGSSGLFALLKGDGRQAWNVKATSFDTTPAYDASSGHVYAGGSDGGLYKIEANTGQIVQTYQAGQAIHKSVLLVGSHAYIVTTGSQFHKVRLGDMSRAWVYSAGSAITTPPSYSVSRELVVFATHDLHIHAVNHGDGSREWREKPTSRPAEYPYTFDGYWPVVAERQGVVFVRLNLGMNALFSGLLIGEWGGGIYPLTNAEIRNFLISDNGKWKNLFALSLDDGKEKFIPAVGYGGVEALKDGNPVLEVGPVPVLRVLPDGKEVAYSHFRSGQGDAKDGRWDSHLGEMVLDGSTVPGLSAGDLRFIYTGKLQIRITDEQTPLTMAGDTIFHAHWGASESVRITDRSDSRGLSFNDPIKTNLNPTIIRRMQTCSDFNPSTHRTSCGLTLFDDGRYWEGPGFWVYWNVLDPPTPSRRAYSEGILPRYTYVSDGLVIVQGNGGELFVLKHSGK
jgi:outer membrane protein assembly factor BamB